MAKVRVKEHKYERAMRQYAEKIRPLAEEDWHVGNLYINALKAAEQARQFDVGVREREKLRDGDTGVNPNDMIGALGQALAEANERRQND